MNLSDQVTLTGDVSTGEIRMTARGGGGYIILPPMLSNFIWKCLQSQVNRATDKTKAEIDAES